MSSPAFTPTPAGALNSDLQSLLQSRNGKSNHQLARKRVARIQQLKANGQAKPATIINFGPLPLRLESGVNFTVPTASDPRNPPANQFRVKFRGVEIAGQFLTIQDPIVYAQIRDARPEGDALDTVAGEYDVMVCKQIEVAHHFFQLANDGSNDSMRCGGVVIFEGDRHVFRKAMDNPNEKILMVPTYEQLADGTREYFSQPLPMLELIESALERMYNYCMSVMQIAQTFYDDPDQRKNITTYHRAWARLALQHKWIDNTPSWMFDTTAAPPVLESCIGCGVERKTKEAQFCTCGRPYDAYQAFLNGENVPPVYLMTLPVEQLQAVKIETRRRKRLMAELEGDEAETAPAKKSKPATPAATGEGKEETPAI